MRPGKGFGRLRIETVHFRMLFKGLIMLSAEGVKIPERKHVAAGTLLPDALRLCFVG